MPDLACRQVLIQVARDEFEEAFETRIETVQVERDRIKIDVLCLR